MPQVLSVNPPPVPCSCRPGRAHIRVRTNVTSASPTGLFAAPLSDTPAVTRCQPDTAAMAGEANYQRHKYMAKQPDTEPANGGRSALTIPRRKVKIESAVLLSLQEEMFKRSSYRFMKALLIPLAYLASICVTESHKVSRDGMYGLGAFFSFLFFFLHREF